MHGKKPPATGLLPRQPAHNDTIIALYQALRKRGSFFGKPGALENPGLWKNRGSGKTGALENPGLWKNRGSGKIGEQKPPAYHPDLSAG